ncbi:MAG: 16S rRNA processing protein RimM [bacterium]|nr:16S rRNA processing protein RimM [bacterium]
MGNPSRQSVVIARVRRPHGIRGKLLVEDLTGGAFVPQPGSKLAFGLAAGEKTITLAKIKAVPQGYIYSLDGYRKRDDVEDFRSVYIEVSRDTLPELPSGEYYYFELIGLPVYYPSGLRIGTVKGVSDMAGGILEVQTEDGELLVPFADKHVSEVELGTGIVIEDIPWSDDEG